MKKFVITILVLVMCMSVPAGAVSVKDVWNNVTETVSNCVEYVDGKVESYVINNHDGYLTGLVYKHYFNREKEKVCEEIHAHSMCVCSSIEELIVW